jgi:hypothetical protein
MSIALIGNFWNLCVTWVNLTNGARLAGIAGGVAFNFLLAILFFGMWRMTPNATDFSKTLDSSELEAMLKKYEGKSVAHKEPNVQDEDIVTSELAQKREAKLHK